MRAGGIAFDTAPGGVHNNWRCYYLAHSRNGQPRLKLGKIIQNNISAIERNSSMGWSWTNWLNLIELGHRMLQALVFGLR